MLSLRRFAVPYLPGIALLMLIVPAPAQEKTAVGSWFGRAVPVNPFCVPQTPGCPIPFEIVMLPTFFADGNFIGIDSNVFVGFHSTAHGEWLRRADGGIESSFLWLQSRDTITSFDGAFRVRLIARLADDPNQMTGFIQAYHFPFAGLDNKVILENGLPKPDPLGAGQLPADCTPLVGCLGRFDFTLRRITVDPPGSSRATLVANPNPILVTDGTGLGQTSLSWVAPLEVTDVEIRVGSPNGTSMGRFPGTGTANTAKWVINGTTFFLQDVTGGKPLVSANTLATVIVSVTSR
ncbi:MAG: hypothetical protein WD696_21655 [Bryobacteraceae bacterium]